MATADFFPCMCMGCRCSAPAGQQQGPACLVSVVLLVHGPEGVDGSARRQHDTSGAARVLLHKLGHVIDAIFVGHPDACIVKRHPVALCK